MTVAQLKRHMDRRFDHLERTKADKSDLSRFVTKDDLKAELKRFATKDDLKGFATKDDLKGYATNHEMQRQFAAVFRRLDSLNDKVDGILRVVRGNQDVLDRVADEHDRRLSDLERYVSGQGSLFPEA